MNLKTVLRTYALLRQLTDDETALLNTLRGMSDSERELLMESLQPGTGTGKKKVGKKTASPSGNNRRGLPEQKVGETLAGIAKMVGGSDAGKVIAALCAACGHDEGYEDHSQPSPHFHQFQPPQQAAATT